MTTMKARQFHLIEDMDIAVFTFAAIERIESAAKTVTSLVRQWVRRSHDRRMMAQMSDRMLSDIGLTRLDLDTEVAKFFWQQ